MNKKLQQRIVGIIAVVALLILVLPHLLSSNDYQIPKPDTHNQTAQNLVTSSTDDFQSPVISVDPIPTVQSNTDPISENMWNQVTEPETIAPNHDPNLSVAEQLLAQSQHNNNPAKTSANAQPKLPKIELIGTTQPTPSNKVPTNQLKKQASTPAFTWFVQVGSYSSRDNANKAMTEYRKRGYAAEVDYLSGQYKVRIGPLKTQENAKNVQSELKRNGVNSYIVQIQ